MSCLDIILLVMLSIAIGMLLMGALCFFYIWIIARDDDGLEGWNRALEDEYMDEYEHMES